MLLCTTTCLLLPFLVMNHVLGNFPPKLSVPPTFFYRDWLSPSKVKECSLSTVPIGHCLLLLHAVKYFNFTLAALLACRQRNHQRKFSRFSTIRKLELSSPTPQLNKRSNGLNRGDFNSRFYIRYRVTKLIQNELLYFYLFYG